MDVGINSLEIEIFIESPLTAQGGIYIRQLAHPSRWVLLQPPVGGSSASALDNTMLLMHRLKVIALTFAVYMVVPFVQGRDWHDTGTGSIVFEEAWTVPALVPQVL